MKKAIATTTVLLGLATTAAAREPFKVYDLTKPSNVTRSTTNQTGFARHVETRLNQPIRLRPGQRVGFFLPGGDRIRVLSGIHVISAKDDGITVRQIPRGPMAGKQLVTIKLREAHEATDYGERMAAVKGVGLKLAPRLDHVLGNFYDRPGQLGPQARASWYVSIDLPGAKAPRR